MADGDGYNWGLTYSDDSQTDACFYSESYVFDWSTFYSASLDPDNWLITPAVGLGGALKFKVWNWTMPACYGMPICDIKMENGHITSSTARTNGIQKITRKAGSIC